MRQNQTTWKAVVAAAMWLLAPSAIAATSKEKAQEVIESAYRLQVMVEGCDKLGATQGDLGNLKRYISNLEKSSGLSVDELKEISDTLKEGFAMAYSEKFCAETGPSYLRYLRAMPAPQ
jgi:hypothetical protein